MTSHTTSDNNDSQRSLGQCLLIFVQNAQKSMITCNAIVNGNYIPPLVTRTSDACVFASLHLFSSFSARPGVQNICFLKVRSLIKPQVMNHFKMRKKRYIQVKFIWSPCIIEVGTMRVLFSAMRLLD